MALLTKETAGQRALAWFDGRDGQRFEMREGPAGVSLLVSEDEHAAAAAEAQAAVLALIEAQEATASFGLTADGLGLSIGVAKRGAP
jgi:hypothetical protein